MSELVAHGPIDVINANGIAPLGAKLAADQRTSPVTARSYTHPALEEGVVVIRLEPDAVAAGIDAEMAAFGFSTATATRPLGQVRSRTLGFPAWALVHEPKKAAAALAVTEDMRKAKRLVAAKPGHAKEAFEKIAKQLQRTAPQFLPSFWEEVGRVVADQASTAMAAQCFERARQAERAYKLKTDPEVADEAFVEFALLGALSAKTLSQYAKDLVKQAGGAEAYRRFRAIVVKRALGGMPPYSGMGKDLQALARAAKANEEQEADKLVEELIEAPGVNKAPIEFWTTYRASLQRLAQGRPELQARLRAIWPEPRGGSDDKRQEFAELWVELLAEIGALDVLPDDGLGAWFSRLFRFAGKTARTEALLRREAARLVALGQPVACLTRARWGTDLNLDLAELILSLGVGLAKRTEDDDVTFSFDTMTVDPVLVAGHAEYGPILVATVAQMIGQAEREHRMRGKQGFVAARRAWIEARIGELEGTTFEQMAAALGELDSKTTPETFLPYGELHARLARVDVTPTLVHHLQGGLVDELGWPAYEEAAAKLGTPLKTGGAFPLMTVWSATKALALGPTGVIAEHDLVYKAKEHELEQVWFVDGQFLVDLKLKSKWQHVQYWSGKPKDTFPQKADWSQYGGGLPDQLALPGGGVTLGARVVRAGDRELPRSRSFLSDGTTIWFGDDGSWFTLDPVKDSKAKSDPPPWVQGFAREGYEITAVLQPAPAGLTSSPLGCKDGLLGMRARTKQDDWSNRSPTVIERIDGVTAELPRGVFALLQLPGDPVPRGIDTQGGGSGFFGGDGCCVELLSPTGKRMGVANSDAWAARGWGVVVPPATFWDYLTPRDPAGSVALRTVTAERVRPILEAALAEVAAQDATPRTLAATEAAIRAALPEVTHPRLIAGIAGIVERAAELARQTSELAAARAKEHADPSGQGLLGEAAQLRKIAKALAAGRELKLPDCDVDPRDWLSNVRARAALSLSPVAEEEHRRKTRAMLQALSGTIFAEDLSRMRTFDLEAPDDWDNNIEWGTLLIQQHEGSTYVIDPNNDWGLEVSSDGKFRVPPVQGTKYRWKISGDKKLAKGVGTAWADRFLELPDEPLAWDPQIATTLAARSGLSEVEAILLWLNVASMSTWSRDFLGKQHRELLGGLKVTEVSAAYTTFEELPEEQLLAMFEKAVPDDPALLRTPLAPGGLVERLGAAWKAKFGKRAKVPQELVTAAKKELDLRDLGKLLPAFAGGADDAKFLQPDRSPIYELSGWGDDALNNHNAEDVITLIAWLFLARPVGCPIRAGIPDVIGKLRDVLDDDKLLWPLESVWFDLDDKKQVAKRDALIDAVDGKAIQLPKDEDGEACTAARDDGAVQVAAFSRRVYGAFRPKRLDKQRRSIEQLAKLLTAARDADEAGEPDGNAEILARVDLLRSEAFRAFGDRVAETPVAEGQYEANPLHSVPKLVDKIAKELAITKDAAALYLQTLALAEPTQQRVCEWNGWKPKQYKDACAELVKKKLLVEGKRERAGRTVFLRGGYGKGDRKNLPMEEWKQPFYTAIDRHLPVEPVHLLFARAWKRVEDGDKPA